MNVAIFASAFYPSIGGVEELVRQLAHEYQRHGMSVIVLTNRWPRSVHRTLYWRSGSYKTLLEGEWKLQVAQTPKMLWLYDLKTDPTERNNLADSETGRVAEMTKRVRIWERDVGLPPE